MLRNGPHGYGVVSKTLHWGTAVTLAAQFAVGYALDPDGGHGRGRGRGRGGGSGHGRGRGGEDGYDVFGGDGLLTVHVVLGLTILTLALLRIAWRAATPLPPWAPTLSPGERVLATWTERTLLATTPVIPATGLWLLAAGDDALAAHIVGHVVFFAALALHLGLVLKHLAVNRDGLLRRMLRRRVPADRSEPLPTSRPA